MRKSLRIVPVLLLFGVIGFICTAPPAIADTLNSLTGSVKVTTVTIPAGTTTSATLHPGGVARVINEFQYQGGSGVGVASADSLGPFAHVQGESHGLGGISALSQVSYYTDVSALAAGIPYCSSAGCDVPVTLQFQLQATASASGLEAAADAEATVDAYFGGVGDVLGGSETMQCVSNGPTPSCTTFASTPVTTGVVFVNGISDLSDQVLIKISAGGSAGGTCDLRGTICGGGVSNGSFNVAADPIVQIADELIPGTNINYRDAFALSFSDGVTQGLGGQTTAPEPGAFSLVLIGIGILLVTRKRLASNLRQAG